MNNSKLTVTVRNKVPEICYGDYLVSDNKQLKIVFDLDSEWDQYAHKTARFNLDGWQFDIAFTGDTVTLPLLPAYTGELKVGVYAGDLATSTAVSIPVRDSVLAPSDIITLDEAAEMARVAAEAERVDAENDRAAAEAERQSNEYIRQFNENLRIEAERARQQAEQNRARNETDRQNAESARADAEQARASAESARNTAESERVRQEQARELAEYRRDQAERARQSAEEARTTAENARAQAEDARNTAESARSAAERARSTADSEREWNETLRQAAESLRAAAENTRAAQENARVSAESAREQSEARRIQNELDRGIAELSREQRISDIIDDFRDYMGHHDLFDVLALIREYGMTAALRIFCRANAPLVGLDEAVLRFFTAAGDCTPESYTSKFYRFGTSPSPIGWKEDANAGLVCEPSTNATAGRDDYAELPLFACFDCNYTIDANTREPVIHAIKGVYGDFSSAPSSGLVGVLQMTGWVRRTADETFKSVEYAAYRKDDGFKPLPEAVRASDNSVRPFVIHAKYAAGYSSSGKPSSVSGVVPISGRPASIVGANVSYLAQPTFWGQLGDQYTGSSICDQAFLQLMLELKYANLGSSNIMKGCCSYSIAYTAAVSETGVKRILLSPEQAADFTVGSSVSLGTVSERGDAACCSVCGIARIAANNTVMLNNTQYGEIVIDTAETFSTAAGETYIVSQPWFTGATDDVLGNDGSPYNNQSGREPFKLQGIEVLIGLWETLGDTSVYDRGGTQGYRVYSIRQVGGSAAEIGSIRKTSGSKGFRYIAELNIEASGNEAYVTAQQYGASASTGHCAGVYTTSGVSGSSYYAVLVFGRYDTEDYAGLVSSYLAITLNTSTHYMGCRVCGTAGNRGVYSENSPVNE